MTYYCQVNDADYDGAVVIEVINHSGAQVIPYVPAWDEWNRPDLAGPFASAAEAEKALDAEVERYNGVARYFMPERDCPHFD